MNNTSGRRGCATVSILFLLAAPAFAATKAIRAGKAIDPNGRPIPNAVIVITDDRITSVGTGAPPPGAEVIDLGRYTVIPGMIDVHTHMTYYWDGTGRPRGVNRLPAASMVLAQANLRRTLETGVTTVRDMNAAELTDVAMRDLIRTGSFTGPR